MSKSLLEIWLDVTLGEVAHEGANDLAGAQLPAGRDSGHGRLQSGPDFRVAQQVLGCDGVNESAGRSEP